MTATASPARRYDLDWVRIFAFGLLILYHTGMYYVTWDWHVKSPHASAAIEPLMLLSSPWRLSLLFLVSGAAIGLTLPATGWIGRRSRRLLLPLLFGMFVIVPPQSYYEVVEKLGYAGGYLEFMQRYLAADASFCRDGQCLTLPTYNHLWFVAYLWVYSLLLAAALRWAPGVMARVEAAVTSRLTGWGLVLWPWLLLGAIRLLLVARFPSTRALVDDWYNHAQYLPVFLLGFFLARNTAIWPSIAALRWKTLLLALLAYTAFLVYASHYQHAEPPQLLRACMRFVYALDQWCAILAMLGFTCHWAPGDSPLRRYLAAAIFPFYIVHQTITVVLAHHLQRWALPPLLEGLLLIAGTAAGCLLSYELVRRIRWLRPCFGLSRQETGRPASPVTRQPTQPASSAS